MNVADKQSLSFTDSLPVRRCLGVAISTPVTIDFRPSETLLSAHCEMLLHSGCDAIAVFGTTGEGPEFSVRDRRSALDAIVSGGMRPERLIVSASALSIPDIVELTGHAMDLGANSILLMPPCVYRSGITPEGTHRFYASVIERSNRIDLRLCLYHFPDICGVPLLPRVIRRLDEAFPGIITGIKDSGGDFDFTEALIRSVGHIGVYTGTELHLPQAIAAGARGTICGLANVMPRLIRAVLDAPTAYDGRRLIPFLTSGDLILSRQPFAASVKAILSAAKQSADWQRMVPPLHALPQPERDWMIRDFSMWEATLPPNLRSLGLGAQADENKVAPLRRVS